MSSGRLPATCTRSDPSRFRPDQVLLPGKHERAWQIRAFQVCAECVHQWIFATRQCVHPPKRSRRSRKALRRSWSGETRLVSGREHGKLAGATRQGGFRMRIANAEPTRRIRSVGHDDAFVCCISRSTTMSDGSSSSYVVGPHTRKQFVFPSRKKLVRIRSWRRSETRVIRVRNACRSLVQQTGVS